MDFRKGKLLHDGKTKRLYATPSEDRLIAAFKDEARFYDAGDPAVVKNRGRYAAAVSTALFRLLENYHIPTHFVHPYKANEVIVQKLEMFSISAVIWNFASSHFSKRYGTEKGTLLEAPIIEWYWKNPKQHHPMISTDHAITFSLAKENELAEMAHTAKKANAVLKSFFERRSLVLADFRLEFGRCERGIVIGDELTLDTCRLWSTVNGQIDTNRFRFDRAHIQQSYVELFEKIGVQS